MKHASTWHVRRPDHGAECAGGSTPTPLEGRTQLNTQFCVAEQALCQFSAVHESYGLNRDSARLGSESGGWHGAA